MWYPNVRRKYRISKTASFWSEVCIPRDFLFSFDHKIKLGIVRMRDVPFLFSLNVPLNTIRTHTHTYTNSHSHSHSYTIQMDSKHILSQYQFHHSIRWMLKVFGINTFPVIITCVTSVLHQSKVAAMVCLHVSRLKSSLCCVSSSFGKIELAIKYNHVILYVIFLFL